MRSASRRTKIVATIGPASRSPDVIRQLILAGMDVARLNFSHGSYADHAHTIKNLRAISAELDTPVTILQDLQGPKVRVGALPNGPLTLTPGAVVKLVPEDDFSNEPDTLPLDYAHAAEEARPGMTVLLADGLYELRVEAVKGRALHCAVVEGGVIESRKGVNFPRLDLRLPALTDKDREDVEFGLEQNVDWLSLSFVRRAEDLRILKDLLRSKGANKPIIAKIEKPQAIDRLDEILAEVNGVMVARGDLGVEMSPEKVPMLQKHIIDCCNRRGLPVITATQMLESMIHDPRPTRAEASDVANAIIDGTDAVMLSGESAVGRYPVRAVEMMDRIAREVEATIEFKSHPANERTVVRAVSAGVNAIATVIEPRAIVVLTTTGHTAHVVAAERPKVPIFAVTTDPQAYHSLNLFWGIRPMLVRDTPGTFNELIAQAESTLAAHELCAPGDNLLVIGGVPTAGRGDRTSSKSTRSAQNDVRPCNFKPMQKILLTMLVLQFGMLAASARHLPSWPYEKLFAQADVVVIADAISTADTADTLDHTGNRREDYVGMNTVMQVHGCLKGDLKIPAQFTVVHFRYSDHAIILDGAMFVRFRLHARSYNRQLYKYTEQRTEKREIVEQEEIVEPKPDYLLFLKRREDGRYEAVSGQYDAALSCREISEVSRAMPTLYHEE